MAKFYVIHKGLKYQYSKEDQYLRVIDKFGVVQKVHPVTCEKEAKLLLQLEYGIDVESWTME